MVSRLDKRSAVDTVTRINYYYNISTTDKITLSISIGNTRVILKYSRANPDLHLNRKPELVPPLKN